MDVYEGKEALRDRMRRARAALPEADVRQASRDVAVHVAQLDALRGARTVAVYAALPGEIDPDAFSHTLRERGVTRVWPRVVRRDPPTLVFCAADGVGALVRGPLGLLQPPDDAAPVALPAIDAFILPGLAFDRAGTRLGFGRGYYDAALREAGPHALRIALAHELQLVDAIPRTDADEPVDFIITPAGAHPTRARTHIKPEANP